MEWVIKTDKTVEEAKSKALDELGIDETEAEFEILEEPSKGLFGRTRGEARVRARIRPKTPRAKDESKRRRRPKRTAEEGTDTQTSVETSTDEQAEQSSPRAQGRPRRSRSNGQNRENNGRSGDSAGRNPRNRPSSDRGAADSSIEDVTAAVEEFLSGVVSGFGLDSKVLTEVVDDQLTATIDGKHGLLVGPRGNTLEAIQELTRVTAQRVAPSNTRIRVDVGGYRELRGEALQRFAQRAAERVVAEGIEIRLEPMSSSDRKIIHDAITGLEGVETRSDGVEPRRRVVIVPNFTA